MLSFLTRFQNKMFIEILIWRVNALPFCILYVLRCLHSILKTADTVDEYQNLGTALIIVILKKVVFVIF